MLNSQTIKDLEDLDHEALFLDHNVRMLRSEKFFEEFYVGFTNRTKIIQLLNAWLYFFSSLYECYGYEGIEKFSESKFGCPIRFSFNYQYGFDIDNKAQTYKNKFFYNFTVGT